MSALDRLIRSGCTCLCHESGPPDEHMGGGPCPCKAASCDLCRLMDIPQYPCRGQDVHCAEGMHCVATTEVCAIDAGRDDHGPLCEHCGAELERAW